jgi:hypothetical protein
MTDAPGHLRMPEADIQIYAVLGLVVTRWMILCTVALQ